MVFLAATPIEIVRRRTLDTSRKRLPADAEKIEAIQEKALLQAFRICSDLKIPLSVATDPGSSHFRRLIVGQ